MTRRSPPTRLPLLARRNPSVKFLAVFFISLVLLFVFDPVTPLLLYLLALPAVVGLGGVPLRRLVRAQLPFASFGVSLLLVNAVSRGGAVVASVGPLEVTDDGVSVGTSLALRTLVIGICAVGFVRTTDPIELVASVHQQARLPARPAFAVLSAYRLLDELPETWRTIRRAQAVRQPGLERGRLPRSLPLLARAGATLLVMALRRAERTAVTLELRGLGAGERTIWRPIVVQPADIALLGVVVAVTVGVLIIGELGGWLRGVGALTS